MVNAIREKITLLSIVSMLSLLFFVLAPVMGAEPNDLVADELELVPLLAVTLSPGETAGATSATVTGYVYGSLVVNITEAEIATPFPGDTVPTAGDNLIAGYESGVDITAGVAAGNYLQVYAVDMEDQDRIVAFYQARLAEEDIKAADVEEDTRESIEEEEKTVDGLRTFGIEPLSSGDVVATYPLGATVTGTLYSDGKLVVSGNGPMQNFNYTTAPFKSVSITSVEIQSGVTTIGNYVFYNCPSLTSITIPDSVTSIGTQAFVLCSSLTSIQIPDSVTSIGDGAFSNCTSLTSINIPNGVTSIGGSTFGLCTSLTSITLPNSLKSIGNQAFTNCTSLTSITIPSSVESIGDRAFQYCSKLATLKISGNPPSVGQNAFYLCASNRSLVFIDEMGVPLTGEALTFAQQAYQAVDDGNTRDNYWYGWRIVPLITPTATDFTFNSASIYNGSPQSANVLGKPGMGQITVKYNGNTTKPVNAGTYLITVDIAQGESYAAINGLSLGTYTINKAELIATVGDYSKTYGDNNPAFTVEVSGFVNGETASTAKGYIAPTASTTATETTGVGTVEIIITGGMADNYTFNTSDKGILTITPKALTVIASADDKTYDGTTAATGTISLDGIVGADDVTARGNFTFADANAGNGKTVNVTGITLEGTAASNYTAAASTTTTANITPKILTPTVVADNKTYDGTTAATGTITLSGIIDDDDVSATGTFAFEDAQPGTGKVVNVTGISLGGAKAGNYSLSTTTATTTADITQSTNTNNNSSGGSSGGSSSESNTPSTPSTPPASAANTGVDILINGKTETAATATTSQEGDRTVTNIIVDHNKVEQKLAQEGNNAVVTIPVSNATEVIVGTLNGQTVKNMEMTDSVLEITTGQVTYTIPAEQINIDAVSQQIGREVALKDIAVNIKISEPSAETIRIVEDTANQKQYQVVVPPIEFEITCTSGNKTVEVTKFNVYVERLVAIPEGIDPFKVTTGVIVHPDGTFSHVPTLITVIDGKYYAKINSLTNSTYLLIYSPKAFKDVEKHWAKEAVNNMASRLVVSGVGEDRFEADRDITRAEFAAILVRALGLMRPGAGQDRFDDVIKKDWYYDAVTIASDYGLISGYGNGKFGPNDKITREQAMAMMARAMPVTKLEVKLTPEETSSILAGYTDAGTASDYAQPGIVACVKTGLISGRDQNTLAPKDNITRAEVAVIVQKLLQKSKLI